MYTRLKRCSVTAFLLTAFLWSQVQALPAHHKLFPANSRVGFSISHMTNRAEGRFQNFDGKLDFAQDHPEQSQVHVTVQVDSIDTGNGSRDSNLREPGYFSVAKYPKMTFESVAFKKTGRDRYLVTGPLTIKGHTKNISVPVQLVKSTTLWATGEQALQFKATFKIDRTEFGVGGNNPLLGNEVEIKLDLEFRQQA